MKTAASPSRKSGVGQCEVPTHLNEFMMTVLGVWEINLQHYSSE